MAWILVLLACVALVTGYCSNDSCLGSSGLEKSPILHKASMLNTLLRNYDNLMRPRSSNGSEEATVVTVDVFVNSFDSVNVDSMDYSVNIYLRQSWLDDRLKYNSIYPNITKLTLDSKLLEKIWVPDLFFPNEKEAHSHCVTVPNRLIRISPDGRVLYSSRHTLTLSCHMNLQYFPLDNQQCEMLLESYGYTIDEIQFEWRNETPIQLKDGLEMPQFDLTGVDRKECHVSYITGEFTCLRSVFSLSRQYGYYLVQNYVPTMLIVILSWVSFWINIDAIPARISLGVLTVLTMTTQCVGVWMSLPRVSYVKAIDIWMSTMVMFVFAAMLEFAIVNTLARKEIRQMSIRARAVTNDKSSDVIKRMMDEYTYGTPKHFDPNSRMLARKVDKVSRKLFPSVFILYNIIYWSFYLSQ